MSLEDRSNGKKEAMAEFMAAEARCITNALANSSGFQQGAKYGKDYFYTICHSLEDHVDDKKLNLGNLKEAIRQKASKTKKEELKATKESAKIILKQQFMKAAEGEPDFAAIAENAVTNHSKELGLSHPPGEAVNVYAKFYNQDLRELGFTAYLYSKADDMDTLGNSDFAKGASNGDELLEKIIEQYNEQLVSNIKEDMINAVMRYSTNQKKPK
jgi:hypothetical protein